MEKEFYVIEVNKGNGATGEYFCEDTGKQTSKHTGYFVTSCIYGAVKFLDKASAEGIFKSFDMTLKEWMITEHVFVNEK